MPTEISVMNKERGSWHIQGKTDIHLAKYLQCTKQQSPQQEIQPIQDVKTSVDKF